MSRVDLKESIINANSHTRLSVFLPTGNYLYNPRNVFHRVTPFTVQSQTCNCIFTKGSRTNYDSYLPVNDPGIKVPKHVTHRVCPIKDSKPVPGHPHSGQSRGALTLRSCNSTKTPSCKLV